MTARASGGHRCRLLAASVLAAHDQARTARADRLAAVARRFQDQGLDLDAAPLGPGSVDVYSLAGQ